MFINRAAAGGRGSRTAFGFLTAQPQAGAVLELPSVFLNRAAVGWAFSCSAFGLFLNRAAVGWAVS